MTDKEKTKQAIIEDRNDIHAQRTINAVARFKPSDRCVALRMKYRRTVYLPEEEVDMYAVISEKVTFALLAMHREACNEIGIDPRTRRTKSIVSIEQIKNDSWAVNILLEPPDEVCQSRFGNIAEPHFHADYVRKSFIKCTSFLSHDVDWYFAALKLAQINLDCLDIANERLY